jgi:phosphatidate cytidylyltransferase
LVWIILGCLLFVWLRGLDGGRNLLLWILVVVWAIDTGAFVFGKLVGGPRLARRISPNKTWAGLIGGIVSAFAAGTGMAVLLYPHQGLLWLGLLAAALALVEQTGDFAESFAKRRFGAKDSGSLIPGHGGALDRLDGLIAVVVVVGLVKLIEAKVW